MRTHWHWLMVIGGMICLVTWGQLVWSNDWGWPVIVGKGAGSMLDLWAMQHFASGILVGALFSKKARNIWGDHWWKKLLGTAIAIAYGLELIELWMEAGGAGDTIAAWFDGLEHWSNRLILDPLVMLLGMFIHRQYPQSALLAGVFTSIWLAVHAFAPKCMYVHDLVSSIFFLS